MPNLAEGRWMTWSDEQGDHIARLDVPGNEAIAEEFRTGQPRRRPTHEEIQRAIQWTAQHPEWQEQVTRELEDIAASRYQEGDTGTPSERVHAPPQPDQGPRLYLDSHTGNIVQADSAAALGGQSRDYWRLVHTEDGVRASLASGEPAIVVPSDFTTRPPMEQIPIVQGAIDRLYREPTTDDPGGPFYREILDLQRQWGVSPPVQGEALPALPSRLPEYPDRPPGHPTRPRSEGEPEGAGDIVPAQWRPGPDLPPRTPEQDLDVLRRWAELEAQARAYAEADGKTWNDLDLLEQEPYFQKAIRDRHGQPGDEPPPPPSNRAPLPPLNEWRPGSDRRIFLGPRPSGTGAVHLGTQPSGLQLAGGILGGTQVVQEPASAPPFPNPPAGEMGLRAEPGIVDRLWQRVTGVDPATGVSLGMIPVTPGALGIYGPGSLIGRTGVPSLSLPALRSARNWLWLSGAKGAGQGGFQPPSAHLLRNPLAGARPFRPLLTPGMTNADMDPVALYRQYLQASQQGALTERLALPGKEEEFRTLMQTLTGVR